MGELRPRTRSGSTPSPPGTKAPADGRSRTPARRPGRLAVPVLHHSLHEQVHVREPFPEFCELFQQKRLSPRRGSWGTRRATMTDGRGGGPGPAACGRRPPEGRSQVPTPQPAGSEL